MSAVDHKMVTLRGMNESRQYEEEGSGEDLCPTTTTRRRHFYSQKKNEVKYLTGIEYGQSMTR